MYKSVSTWYITRVGLLGALRRGDSSDGVASFESGLYVGQFVNTVGQRVSFLALSLVQVDLYTYHLVMRSAWMCRSLIARVVEVTQRVELSMWASMATNAWIALLKF